LKPTEQQQETGPSDECDGDEDDDAIREVPHRHHADLPEMEHREASSGRPRRGENLGGATTFVVERWGERRSEPEED